MINDKSKVVPCKKLEVRLCNDEQGVEKIPYENYWEFDFFVEKNDSTRILLNTITSLAPYRFRQMQVALTQESNVLEQFVWTEEAIQACLKANLMTVEIEEEKGPKLTLN